MIPESGRRFPEKIMLKQRAKAKYPINLKSFCFSRALFFDERRSRRFLDMGAVWAVRHRPPPVRRRVVAPDLGALRPVLMPGPRLEKAELFVVHLIHLAEEFYHDAVRAPVIDRNIVP